VASYSWRSIVLTQQFRLGEHRASKTGTVPFLRSKIVVCPPFAGRITPTVNCYVLTGLGIEQGSEEM
jgi:hypothetical protein